MAPKADAKPKADPKPKQARPKKPALNKARALQQISSLAEDDDERTAISKKISWILRKGADRIGIASYTMNKESWYKLSDIMSAEILDDIAEKSEEKFMSVVKESNAQKLRYEIKEGSDGIFLRALSKGERKKPEESSSIVEKTNQLRGDAPAFVPSSDANKTATGVAMAYSSAMSYPYGYPMGYPGYPWPYGYGAMMGGMQPTAAAPSAERRFTGTIKSFNPEKGYGFIESAEAYTFYQRDVFLHKALIGNLSVGAQVTFTVEVNKEGMPQARDIKGTGGTSGGKGKGKGKGKKGEKGEKGEKKEKGDGEGKGKKKKEKKGEESKEPGEATSEATAPASTEATSA